MGKHYRMTPDGNQLYAAALKRRLAFEAVQAEERAKRDAANAQIRALREEDRRLEKQRRDEEAHQRRLDQEAEKAMIEESWRGIAESLIQKGWRLATPVQMVRLSDTYGDGDFASADKLLKEFVDSAAGLLVSDQRTIRIAGNFTRLAQAFFTASDDVYVIDEKIFWSFHAAVRTSSDTRERHLTASSANRMFEPHNRHEARPSPLRGKKEKPPRHVIEARRAANRIERHKAQGKPLGESKSSGGSESGSKQQKGGKKKG